MPGFKILDILGAHFESLDPPLSSQEQCCISKGVSEECLVLCRKDPNYEDSPNYDDTKFPNDTPCEKHKSGILECWRVQGILDFILVQISVQFKIFEMFGKCTLAFIYIIPDVNGTESTKPANMTTNATIEKTTPMPTTPKMTSK